MFLHSRVSASRNLHPAPRRLNRTNMVKQIWRLKVSSSPSSSSSTTLAESGSSCCSRLSVSVLSLSERWKEPASVSVDGASVRSDFCVVVYNVLLWKLPLPTRVDSCFSHSTPRPQPPTTWRVVPLHLLGTANHWRAPQPWLAALTTVLTHPPL